MKFNVLLSILFSITIISSAIHEAEHTIHEADSSCIVCQVNNNLASADIIDQLEDIEIIHFGEISQSNTVLNLYLEEKNNRNRAPPSLS